MSNVSVKTIRTLHSERSNRSFKNIYIYFKNLPQCIICEKNKITVHVDTEVRARQKQDSGDFHHRIN